MYYFSSLGPLFVSTLLQFTIEKSIELLYTKNDFFLFQNMENEYFQNYGKGTSYCYCFQIRSIRI